MWKSERKEMMEICFEHMVSHLGKDRPVDLIWRQIMKSVWWICAGVIG